MAWDQANDGPFYGVEATTVAAQQCGLDEEGLAAAHKEAFRVRTAEIDGDEIEHAIAAYLTHAAGDVAGLVERLTTRLRQSGLYTDAKLADDAAAALSAIQAENERMKARVKALEAAAQALINRLNDFENELGDSSDCTRFYGHVEPAMGRLAASLAARSTLAKDGNNGQ